MLTPVYPRQRNCVMRRDNAVEIDNIRKNENLNKLKQFLSPESGFRHLMKCVKILIFSALATLTVKINA